MRIRGMWRYSKVVLLVLALVTIFGGASTAMAVTSSSDNYQVTETQFNAGSALKSCSGQYCARTSIGDMTDAQSENYESTTTFGDIIGEEPFLEMIVEPGESNLGVLTTESTATKTTSVRIRSYLSDGYTLQITGAPPKFGDHTLATRSTPSRSVPGVEQFGINLVANTTPSVGTNPVQTPADQVTFGVVEDNYYTQNLFMYANEAILARSTAQTGQTDYTISMIVNIGSSTPAGHYSGDFAAILIPAF